MSAVKGLRGYWHYTDNEWDKSGNKLKTACGCSISPNFREEDQMLINCPRCVLKCVAIEESGFRA